MKNQNTIVIGGMAMVAGLAGASAQESSPLFKVGSVDVRPHATYSLMYDDNIFLDHKAKTAGGRGNAGRDHDFIHTFTPGLRLNAGDAAARQSAYFDANYEVVVTRFSNYSGSDAIDHNASVEFGGKFNRLSLGVSQKLESRSDADAANLAANGRAKRKTWTTEVKTSYEVSEKTTSGLDLTQVIGDYEAPLVDSAERMANLYLDYQVLPKVKMGLGATVGYLQVDGTAANHNANSAYEQGLLRLNWAATEKLSINATGGIEHRNIQERGATDPDNFVFQVTANWKATEQTTVGLGVTRASKVSNAQLAQLNQETAVSGSVKHQLWESISLGIDAGYSYSHYKATTAAAAAVRDDNYIFAKPSLSYRFAERAQATVFYQYRRNDSNLLVNANDFYGNQLGLELSYRF